jgi:hypothetical protein
MKKVAIHSARYLIRFRILVLTVRSLISSLQILSDTSTILKRIVMKQRGMIPIILDTMVLQKPVMLKQILVQSRVSGSAA